jgi:hypothetical protein
MKRLPLLLALVMACDPATGDDAGTDAARADGGRSDGGAPIDGAIDDAPIAMPDAAIPDGVPMFVATGKFGRITTSCDDGRTWGFNRSDDESGSCVGIDCDHHAGSATGLTYGGGYFFASYGWGDHPARVLRSANGVDWDTVYDQRGFSLAGIAWAGDRLVGGDVTPRYAVNADADPITFAAAEWPDYDVPEGAWPNSRWIAYAPHDGGRIALIAAAGDGSFSDTVVSRDDGLTYQHPTSFPEECTGHNPRMAYGNGVWVQTWSTTGAVCTSSDGGDTFSYVDLGEGGSSGAVFTGTEFLVYIGGMGHRSADGIEWSSFPVSVGVGAIAMDPATGTFIALDGNGWGRPYDMQRLYRSTDGEAFELLGESAFTHSHPLTHITFGYGSSSASCP